MNAAPNTSLPASADVPPAIALGCGGTGGHLFPGLAVAAQLVQRGCTVKLFVSAKDVDQHAVKTITGMQIVTLPAIGLQGRHLLPFIRGLFKSYRVCQNHFRCEHPQAALAMGGFTSVPPLLAAKRFGASTFLHESNTIPGRANRWLSRIVDHAFVGFPGATAGLHTRNVSRTGTPVRAEFKAIAPERCRAALGLDPGRAVMLVMGGSQGASAINDLVIRSLPLVAARAPHLQWIHLTGPNDQDRVTRAYDSLKLTAITRPFVTAMDLVLGAATAAVSRAGASSLAELAAMRLPAVLVPYPAAADNHQFHNARTFEQCGAARLLEQSSATPEALTDTLLELVENALVREHMQNALTEWHAPHAAEQIALAILKAVNNRRLATHDETTRHSPSSQYRSAIA